MAIRHRRGKHADFDPEKLKSGELAVCEDVGKIYVRCGDNVIELTYHPVDDKLSVDGENPVQGKVISAKFLAIEDLIAAKSSIGHTHNYAGSSSAGGSANSAVKLDSSAGSATQPVYFADGKPVATTYTLGASVPSGAKFTDTTYGVVSTTADGLAPKRGGTTTKFLRDDGTWAATPDTNTMSMRYCEHLRWYIAASGDDETGDGSAAKPWKTLDKFFSMLNEGYTDIRCYIVETGTYEYSKPVISNAVIHITATCSGVAIKCTNTNEPAVFYNCHLNFQTSDGYEPMTFESAYGTFYPENTATMFKYVRTYGTFKVFGGYLYLNQCSIDRLWLYGAVTRAYRLTVHNTEAKDAISIENNSQFSLSGTFTVDSNSNGGSNSLIYMKGGVANLNSANAADGYAYGITADEGLIICTQKRLEETYSTNIEAQVAVLYGGIAT